MENNNLPLTIETGVWRGGHIQGIALDRARGHLYCSFTTELVKFDLAGNVLGSVKGFTGHLGCLAMGEDGRVYGSLEYKNDSIGKGILDLLGVENEVKNAFYVAIFDGEKITERDMNAEKGGVMHTVWLREPTEDYLAEWAENGKTQKHRHGCSGIDGVTFAPAFEGKGMRLLVAYGVYGDNEREDNDYQVLLSYDPAELAKYEAVLAADNIHTSGPERAEAKYFVYTGNTTFGVQNMEYDSHTGDIFMAVYRGRKEKFLNYNLFRVAGKQTPKTEVLRGVGIEGKTLSLAKTGLFDEKTGIYTHEFKHGSTGLLSLGDGYFYISEAKSENGEYSSVIRLYRYTGEFKPFAAVEEK
ncbi:MAG: hypothetical protein IJX55_00680 [Clostridia bacterium]|nr:hypothetical protein [Clostridia bacterium]